MRNGCLVLERAQTTRRAAWVIQTLSCLGWLSQHCLGLFRVENDVRIPQLLSPKNGQGWDLFVETADDLVV